jgi:site-specific DNA-cytosine methylase
MTFTAIDCQSYAGGFALGVVQAGFKLAGKREQAGAFGVPAMEANRHLLGTEWIAEDGPADTWTPVKVDLLFGNPPCSGFSNRSAMVRGKLDNGEIGRVQYRGVDSVANSCMWDLVGFAAKCDPQIVIFESVQGAYQKGRSLMQALRTDLEKRTGQDWTLYHVLHNVSDLGGAQVRLRYFWVASRIPFGVLPLHTEPTTVQDRIGDLETVELGSMDGHVITETAQTRRINELAAAVTWKPDETSGEAYARAVEENIPSSTGQNLSSQTKARPSLRLAASTMRVQAES